VQTAQTASDLEGGSKSQESSTTQNMGEIMAKLQGMSIKEKDKMIDALIGQEDF